MESRSASIFLDLDKCSACSADVSQYLGQNCPTCGAYLGPPNVREVSRPEEVEALEVRYKDVLEEGEARGAHASLKCFDADMQQTQAVINMGLDKLNNFITNSKALYSSYVLQVRGQMRKPADPQDDRDRRTIESMIFGSYGEEIRYAALSLDGRGVSSYGDYILILREVAVEKRATLLEENSYHFVEHHDMRPRQPVPRGYRSTWQNRHKLAVAKLGSHIGVGTVSDEHASLLLFSEGNRVTDGFIEVHLYGAFDMGTVAAVRGRSVTRNRRELAKLAVVKEILREAGKDWIEV